MASKDSAELLDILDALESQRYQVIGIIARDPKLGVLALAPLKRIPEDFVELIGRRLGNLPARPWQPIVGPHELE